MKKVLTLAAVALFASANAGAVPITGTVEFSSVPTVFLSRDGSGTATDDSGDGVLLCADPMDSYPDCGGAYEGGPATGVDYDGNGLGDGALSADSIVTAATGSLSTHYGLSFGNDASFYDFDLNAVSTSAPALEWVVDTSGIIGQLEFFIIGGSETDESEPGFWDLAGTGFFKFTPDDGDVIMTDGSWSLSNAGGVTISAANAVPAPSVLGLLGLGLISLGLIRRRRIAK